MKNIGANSSSGLTGTAAQGGLATTTSSTAEHARAETKRNFYRETQEPRLPFGIGTTSGERYSIRRRSSKPVVTEESPYSTGRVTGPIKVFKKIIESWGVDELSATRMLGFDDDELLYVQNILNGLVTLRGRDPKDRISNLFVIKSSLTSLFRDIETENAWLREPQEELDGRTPIEYITNGAFEKLLRVRHLIDVMTRRV